MGGSGGGGGGFYIPPSTGGRGTGSKSGGGAGGSFGVGGNSGGDVPIICSDIDVPGRIEIPNPVTRQSYQVGHNFNVSVANDQLVAVHSGTIVGPVYTMIDRAIIECIRDEGSNFQATITSKTNAQVDCQVTYV